MNLMDLIPEGIKIAIGAVAGLIVLAVMVTVIVALIKKVPIDAAARLMGLSAALALVVGIGAVITVILIMGRKGKTNASGSHVITFPADSGSAAIRRAFDETRDRIRARITALLLKG